MDSEEKWIELKYIIIRMFARYGLFAPLLLILYPVAFLQERIKKYFQSKINETQQ